MANLNQDVYGRVMHALDLISQGKTETKACSEARITKHTLEHYLGQDDFLAMLAAEAVQRGYDVMADILLHIDTDMEYGSSDPKIMKIKSDNIKWFLSRKNGLKYGDRLTVENIITADKTVVEMLSRGKQRAIEGKLVPSLVHGVVEDVVAVIVDANEDASQFF